VALGAFAALMLLSIGFVAGYLYLSKSDYFAVRHLDIRGLSRISREDLLSASGLDKSVNNLTFDTQAAARSLMSLPWVEKASISKDLPSRINIAVTEYRPKALVALDHLWYMDARGRPFKKLDPGENPDLPIISGFALDELAAGGPLALEALEQVFQLMEILSQRTDDFRLENISEFHCDLDSGLTVFTRSGGLEIKVGTGSYAEKFRRLGRVVSYLKQQGQMEGLAWATLESPPRVTVRYGPGGRPQGQAQESPVPPDRRRSMEEEA
jgi:cell division septal protein FtsQ